MWLTTNNPTPPHSCVGPGVLITTYWSTHQTRKQVSPHPTHTLGYRGGQVFGGYSVGETPGPISNPEAKTHSADGTALGRVWESKTPPKFTSVEGMHTHG